MSAADTIRERATEIAGSVTVNELWCGAAQTLIYDMRDERDALLAENQQLREALEMIAESLCLPNMDGDCVGAVHSRRKRYDDPERIKVVGCPKHFAENVLARVEKSK